MNNNNNYHTQIPGNSAARQPNINILDQIGTDNNILKQPVIFQGTPIPQTRYEPAPNIDPPVSDKQVNKEAHIQTPHPQPVNKPAPNQNKVQNKSVAKKPMKKKDNCSTFSLLSAVVVIIIFIFLVSPKTQGYITKYLSNVTEWKGILFRSGIMGVIVFVLMYISCKFIKK